MKRVIAFVMLFLLLLLTSCHEKLKKEDLNDINLFISEDYAKEVEDNGESIWWKRDAGVYAKEFFPKYDEIQHGNSSTDFFVRFYENKGGFLDAAFVLELSFDDFQKYEEAKLDIYSKYAFLEKRVRDDDGIGFVIPVPEFETNKFLVKIITKGNGEDDYPHHIRAMGFNDTDNVIRYIYLYDIDSNEVEESSLVSYVKGLCNGNW